MKTQKSANLATVPELINTEAKSGVKDTEVLNSRSSVSAATSDFVTRVVTSIQGVDNLSPCNIGWIQDSSSNCFSARIDQVVQAKSG